MAQTQILKRRIRSIGNTKQITKAMEIVAASRMRRVAEAVSRSRAYRDLTNNIMSRLLSSEEAKQHPYLKPAPAARKLYIIFSSDRGFVGSYNANIFNTAIKDFTDSRSAGRPGVIIFGRKGAKFFSRFKEIDLLGEYQDIADAPDVNIFAGVLETIHKGIMEGQFSAVQLIYTEFLSTLSQQVRNLKLLPVESASQPELTDAKVYEFEPSAEDVLTEILRLYLEAQLMQARVEAAASEYAMRMMAMNNANRNAGELIDDLTLELNATRQGAITAEIAEVTAGANAITQGG